MSHFDIAKAQGRAWAQLSGSFVAGRVASTYLFVGSEGLGDWPLAVEFAALLNCPTPVENEEKSGLRFPCGICQSCRSIRALNSEGLRFVVPIGPHKNAGEAVDLTNQILEWKRKQPFQLLEASVPTHISINMAREVKKALSLKSAEGMTRVVVFYKMEKMRPEATDALLKLIEEPPLGTVLILTSRKVEALLPTIQSRAQKIRLKKVPEALIVEHLQSAYGISESRAHLCARLADGNMGFATKMADRDTAGELDSRAVGLLLFKSLFAESRPNLVSQVLDMINFSNRGEVEECFRLWQTLIRDCAFYAGVGEESDLVNIDFIEEIRSISRWFGDLTLAERMTTTIKNALADFRLNVHIRVAFVATVLKLRIDIAAAEVEVHLETTDG